jgi:hypothetical protein
MPLAIDAHEAAEFRQLIAQTVALIRVEANRCHAEVRK